MSSTRKDFDGEKKRVSKGRRRRTAGWGVIKKSMVIFVVVFVVSKVSFLKKFTFLTTRSDHDKKKKEKNDNVPPRRALSTESSSNTNNRARDLGINAFRLNTFNLDEAFPRRFILPKTSNETSLGGEEKEGEGEEESQQFLAKLIDAFMKQNSALYDAKMKALGGVRSSSSLDDDDDDAFISSSFPLQRLRRVGGEPSARASFDARVGSGCCLSSSRTWQIRIGTVWKTD